MLLIGLLFLACSVCFVTQSRNTGPRLAPHAKVWALSHQSSINKMLYRHAIGQSYAVISSVEVPSSQMIPDYMKLTKKSSPHSMIGHSFLKKSNNSKIRLVKCAGCDNVSRLHIENRWKEFTIKIGQITAKDQLITCFQNQISKITLK